MNLIRAAAVLAGALLCWSANAESASLLVLSKRDHTLALVDPTTLKVVAKVPVGDDPHEVVASSDGSTAYVSDYGGGTLHTLSVVDLLGKKALPAIELGALKGPHGLDFNGGKVWFTAEGAKAIGRYDPATQKVDLILGTGQNRTHMIEVFPDAQTVVLSNVSSGTISVFSEQEVKMPPPPPGHGPPGGGRGPGFGGPFGPKRDWNQAVIKVGNGSEGFDLTPDRKEIWVGNARDGTISIIDLASQTVIATLAANVQGANRLRITPDGKYALVSMLSGPDVAVFEVSSRKEVKRIPVGHGSAGILITPDGARAFVACTGDDVVKVLDLRTLAVTGSIEAGGGPDGMAWAIRR
jgi:YVTN family beta-propeller protein